MRIERIYEWKRGQQLVERDPQPYDPSVSLKGWKRLVHISDTHLGKEGDAKRKRDLRQWFQALEHLHVDAVVHSGDVVESPGDEASLAKAKALFEEAPMPVVGVVGNHDVEVPGEASVMGRYFGACPEAREVGGVLYWRIDSMAAPVVEDRSQRECQEAADSGFYSTGAVGEEQLEALDELMDKEPRRSVEVAVVHHHLRQPVPVKPWYEANADLMAPLLDAGELVERLRDRGVGLVLHGHRHQYVAPYQPWEDLVVLNGGSSTRRQIPQRIRLIDWSDDGEQMRVWEVARYRSNVRVWG